MRINVLVGGKAGQGPNTLSNLVAFALIKRGYHVFVSRDYESVIRGGHNFNVLTFSSETCYSNDSGFDVLVALDKNTLDLHKKDLKKTGFILSGDKDNMYFAGALFKVLCLDFNILEEELKKMKNFEQNLESAREGYLGEKRKCVYSRLDKGQRIIMNGSQGIASGSVKSGMDIYYAYPMTPATPALFELANMTEKNNFLTLELESEISVVMAALGSSATGAKVMVGTSGGGFDLMTEGFSMAAQAEIPLVVYLASRPGPGTGVATYTGQGDLKLALNCGHGEFFRLVLAPGSPEECEELVSQAFYFSQKFKTQAIVLSDKHLAESFFTLDSEGKITKSSKNFVLGRINSYEHNKTGEATENAKEIVAGFERRMKTQKLIESELNQQASHSMKESEATSPKFEMYKVYGKKDSKNLVISYGSTKGAILDAIKDLDCKFLQVLYLSPFSSEIEKEIKGAKKVILVENSSSGALGDLIREKTGFKIEDKNKILRYDGRPFLSDELNLEIRKRLR